MRDCHRMKKYKIDRSKNIGNVIFVVEGGRPETGGTELRLLKKVFADILGYEVQELRRGCDEFIGHGVNPQYRVFALNLPKNQLTHMTDEALDTLYARISGEFGIKPELIRIVFPDGSAENVDLHQKIVDRVFTDDMCEAENRLIHSVTEMDKGLQAVGLGDYDLDNLAPTLLNIYDKQQEKYALDKAFSLISLVAMAFLELGVIVECDEE